MPWLLGRWAKPIAGVAMLRSGVARTPSAGAAVAPPAWALAQAGRNRAPTRSAKPSIAFVLISHLIWYVRRPRHLCDANWGAAASLAGARHRPGAGGLSRPLSAGWLPSLPIPCPPASGPQPRPSDSSGSRRTGRSARRFRPIIGG